MHFYRATRKTFVAEGYREFPLQKTISDTVIPPNGYGSGSYGCQSVPGCCQIFAQYPSLQIRRSWRGRGRIWIKKTSASKRLWVHIFSYLYLCQSHALLSNNDTLWEFKDRKPKTGWPQEQKVWGFKCYPWHWSEQHMAVTDSLGLLTLKSIDNWQNVVLPMVVQGKQMQGHYLAGG